MLNAGKVNHISGLLVDAVADKEKNAVNNNFKLIFTPRTILLSVIDDCLDISCQHLLPFVSFFDALHHSQTHDNV